MDWSRHLLIVPILLPLVTGAALLLIDELRHSLKALINLASTLMAVGCACCVVALLAREEHPLAGWFGLAVLLNPFVWIAGTSMVDFAWAVALLLAGAHAQLERRW